MRSHLRDYEYKRLGTVLAAGRHWICTPARVTEIVNNTHKSSDFIEFLTGLDVAYPATQTLRLILDNHSVHISRETQTISGDTATTVSLRFHSLSTAPGLNLVNLFSKMTRTMLREIRVATKQELIDRIHLYFREVNAAPVVFRWKYKMDEIDLTSGSLLVSLKGRLEPADLVRFSEAATYYLRWVLQSSSRPRE